MNGDLPDFTKLLEDLLKALSNRTGAKEIIPKLKSVLEKIENSNPDLSDLIQQLMDMLDKLQNGDNVNMGDFLKTLGNLSNQIRAKGKALISKREDNIDWQNHDAGIMTVRQMRRLPFQTHTYRHRHTPLS